MSVQLAGAVSACVPDALIVASITSPGITPVGLLIVMEVTLRYRCWLRSLVPCCDCCAVDWLQYE